MKVHQVAEQVISHEADFSGGVSVYHTDTLMLFTVTNYVATGWRLQQAGADARAAQ